MENREMNNQQWVNERLAVLDPANKWQPDIASAFTKMRRKRGHSHQTGWTWGAVAAIAGCALLLALPTRGDCAQPLFGVVCLNRAAASAPALALEIYSDYECPACAGVYSETWPQLEAQYVQTGKVRLVHRDFPLSQHPYAKLAARYANAAGETGQYDVAMMQLFKTQHEWERDGGVDAAVAQVLPPGGMQKVRDVVAHETR
jgi:hypothetical protein